MNEAELRAYDDQSRALKSLVNNAVELLPERSAFMLEAIDAGEPQLAFETLCENISEFEIPLSVLDREIINALATGLDAEKYARYLDDNPLRE